MALPSPAIPLGPGLIMQSSSGSQTATLQTELYKVLHDVIWPFAESIHYFIILLGVCLIWAALHRVKHHTQGQQGNQQNHKPMSTIMMFTSGALLVSYSQLMQAITTSLLGGFIPAEFIPPNQTSTYTYTNQILMYANAIKTPTTGNITQIEYVTYGLLAIVGLFSFLVGIHKLIKAGEGQQGGEQSILNKALMHIFAGFFNP